MDEEERRAYANSCMHFFKFNADTLAPIFDDLTPRARGEALNAVYGLALYGEEPGHISKAARSAYMCARPNVLKARANASLKADPSRPDTRPGTGAGAVSRRQLAADSAAATRAVLREHEASTHGSTQRVQAEYSTSTGGSTRVSTQSGKRQPTGETPGVPPDIPPDVPPDTLSTMGLSTMGLVDDALGAPAYETGGGCSTPRARYAESGRWPDSTPTGPPTPRTPAGSTVSSCRPDTRRGEARRAIRSNARCS